MAILTNGYASGPDANPLGGQQTGPASILDQYGQPIRAYDQYAVPQVITFASILGSSYRTYWHQGYDEAVRHSREDALAMRRDAFLLSLLRERQRSVARLKWHLEPDDDKDAGQIMVTETLTKILRSMPRFRWFLMAQLEAIWYGRYGSQFQFTWATVDGLPALQVVNHIPVNGDKIGYTYDHTPYLLVHVAEARNLGLDYLQVREDEIVDPTHAGLIHTTLSTAVALRGTWRERFQIHRFEVDDADYFENEQADAVHGVGIRSRIFWLDWLRREWLAWFSDFLERVGLGITVWEFDASNPKAKAEVEKAAREQSRRANILMPRWPGDNKGQGGSVYRVETPLAGAEALIAMKRAIEDQIERYIVGQQASSRSETSGLGTHDNTMQAETKGAITELDADSLAETITGSEQEPGLLHILKKWTFPTADFAVRFKFDVNVPDPKKTLEAVKAAWEMGVSFIQPEVRALTGLSNPQEGDDVLEGQSQQDPNAFGEEGFFGGKNQNEEDGEKQGGEEPGGKDEANGKKDRPAPRFDHQRQHYAKDEGKWITIGASVGSDGEKHGGTPVFIVNGRITKGHPRLAGRKISALKEEPEEQPTHRQGLQQSKGYGRAVWGKKARKEGVMPQHLHQLAGELLAHDREFKEDLTKMLREARQISKAGTGEYADITNLKQRAARGDLDASHIKGFDLLTKSLRNSYPELLGDDEQEAENRLWEYLMAGNPEALSEDDAYQQAFDHLMEQKEAQEAEPVPFHRQRDWITEHESHEEAKYRRMARAYLKAKEERHAR